MPLARPAGALLITATVIVVLMLTDTAPSDATAPQPVHARPPITDAMLADFAELDGKLEDLIKELKDKGTTIKPKELEDRLENLDGGVLEFKYFGETVNGFTFHDAAGYMHCIDAHLSTALGVQTAVGKKAAGGRAKARIKQEMQVARNCANNFRRALHQHDPPLPEALLDKSVKLDGSIKDMQKDQADDELNREELEKRVKKVEKQKVAIADELFPGMTYDIEYSEVFHQFDCMRRYMGFAAGLANGAEDPEDQATAIAGAVRKAKNCKEDLEAHLRTLAAQPLRTSEIKAQFDEATRSTTYSIPVLEEAMGATVSYKWTLSLQAVDPNVGVDQGCNNRGTLTGTGATFVWHHGNTGDPVSDDGCNHGLQGAYGHQGLITVVVSDDRGWSCTATYKGSNTSPPNSVDLGIASAPDCKRG